VRHDVADPGEIDKGALVQADVALSHPGACACAGFTACCGDAKGGGGSSGNLLDTPCGQMRKDVREFIRRLEAEGLTVESTPGHYHVFRDGKPLRKANGMPFTLPFSPDTTRWRKTAILDLRKLGIDV